MALTNKVEQFEADADIAHQLVRGDKFTTVDIDGRPQRSFSKMIEDTAAQFGGFAYDGAFVPGKSYGIGVLYSFGGNYYLTKEAHVATTVAADEAAGKVRVYQELTDADLEPIRERMKLVVTIQDLGGAGDFDLATGTGTNNFFPLLNYTRLFNDAPTVHFPFITGMSNIYHFQYDTNYGFGRGTVRITADPGVKFHSPNIGFENDFGDVVEMVPPILPGTTERMGLLYLESSPYPQPLYDKRRDFVGAGDLVRNRFRKVDPTRDFVARQYFWPGSPSAGGSEIEIGAGSGAITYTSDTVEFNTSGTGTYEVAEIRLKVGERLHCSITIPPGVAGITPAAFARTAMGYYGITWAGGQAGGVEKEAGLSYANPAITVPQDAYRSLHATFDPSQAIITIEPTSPYSFNILVNGALFRSRTVKHPIQAFGIGGYLGAPAAGVRYENLWIEENGAQNSTGLMGLFYIGDSRQADAPSCPGRWCAKYIDGSLGMRVSQYRNQAVGGNASNNQLDILLANGVPSGTTDTVIAVGTNDAQGAVAPSALYANTKQMIDICMAAGSRVVLDLFPLWYERNQAGPRGQASMRYATGNPYRAVMMRLGAEYNIPVVDMLTEAGLLIANFVNPTAGGPNLTHMDPILNDNIHGNATLGRLQGWAHAKAILGQINKVSTNRLGWTAFPSVWQVQQGWSNVADAARFRSTDSGDVEFRMHLNIPVGAGRADGTAMHSLGKYLTPTAPVIIPAATNLNEFFHLVIGTDGGLRCYGLAGKTGTTARISSGVYSTY